MANKKKPKKINLEDLGGFVFSTNPDFVPHVEEEETVELSNEEQRLEAHFEKKGRGGKQVVIIRNFQGSEEALQALGTVLKKHCGVGGSVKENEIILQGNVRDKAMAYLREKGFGVVRVGG